MKSKRSRSIRIIALLLCLALSLTVPMTASANDQNNQGENDRYCTVNFWSDYYGTEKYVIEVPRGGMITMPDYPFSSTMPGQKFVGWEDPCDYTNTTIKPGAAYTITANYYFYAKYEKEDSSYATIRFDLFDNSLATGQMEPILAKKGSTITLPTPTFKPAEGYEFDCWSPGGQPGDTYQLPDNLDEYVFWAKYKEEESSFCEVIYDNGYGITYTDKVKMNKKYSLAGQVVKAPRKNMKFGGWVFTQYKNPEGSDIKLKDTVYASNTIIDIGSNSTIKLTAKWYRTGLISDCTITVDQGTWFKKDYRNDGDYYIKEYAKYENYYYRGEPITPIYTVTDKDGYILTEGVDFIAEYSNNIKAGFNALITIYGINGFENTGTKTAKFNVRTLTLTYDEGIGNVFGSGVFTFDNVNYTHQIIGDEGACYYYNGEEIHPEFKVTYIDGYKDDAKRYDLPMSDFTLTVLGKKKPIGIGIYSYDLVPTGENVEAAHSISQHNGFKIIPPKQYIRKVETRYTAPDKKLFGIGVTFKKTTKVLNRVEIEVRYTLNGKEETKIYTVKGKGKELKDFDLTEDMLKAKKIKLRVRYSVKVKGDYYNGPWSKTRVVKLNGR